ncbi:MAG: kinase/pyrophosphorylase [Woeseiaceae bacterium]|nr:kinase/pyrophosphorylase [Woeseiaceae bacterium]
MRFVYFLSDQTGVTAETLGHSLITQFDGQDFQQVTLPFIDNEDKAKEAVLRINSSNKEQSNKPIIFSTFISEELREIVKEVDGLHLDIFDVFLEPLENELKLKSTQKSGLAHGMSDANTYMKRIEATNYALSNDDGGVTRHYDKADIILLGISRSGKTPTCLYLALQYGIYAANFPLTDEELENGAIPESLNAHRKKLFGLTISADRLRQIRKERRAIGNYASIKQISYEIREAEKLYVKNSIKFVDTSELSIEEISGKILEKTGVQRRFRP